MSSCSIVMTEMLFFLFGILCISLFSPRVLNLLLIKLGGALKIDLPLSMFCATTPLYVNLIN